MERGLCTIPSPMRYSWPDSINWKSALKSGLRWIGFSNKGWLTGREIELSRNVSHADNPIVMKKVELTPRNARDAGERKES